MHVERESVDESARAAASRCAAVLIRLAGLGLLATALISHPSRAQDSARSPLVERGRYLVRIAGCNDCHTAGYATAGGQVPEAQWLTGVPIGFEGPWGVSYPANLRLRMSTMTEAQWLAVARAPRLPPMPWFALRDMSDADLRALYAYVRWLGPAGEETPAALAPGRRATTPVIVFVPTESRNADPARLTGIDAATAVGR
jgi:mono/diheme cytochrome c family protein